MFIENFKTMAHDIDYKIIGDDIQVVEIELDPGEAVRAEAAKAAAAKAEEAKAALAKTSGATPLPREARGPAPKSEPDAKVDEEKKKKKADDEAQKR